MVVDSVIRDIKKYPEDHKHVPFSVITMNVKEITPYLCTLNELQNATFLSVFNQLIQKTSFVFEMQYKLAQHPE